jgi:nucleoside-diphosphate-sugar epimerase
MIWCALKGKEFVIYGDGSQSRDLIYVKDVVEANIKALEYEENKFEVFNVGSGKSYSFNEMIDILRKNNLEIKVKYVENPIKNYVYKTLADVKKAKEILKFKAKYEVEEIIPKIIEYYKSKLDLIKI